MRALRPLGLTPVLEAAWTRGFTVKSNFARSHAEAVAAAASLGLITTRKPGEHQSFRSSWLITPRGLTRLWATSTTSQSTGRKSS